MRFKRHIETLSNSDSESLFQHVSLHMEKIFFQLFVSASFKAARRI